MTMPRNSIRVALFAALSLCLVGSAQAAPKPAAQPTTFAYYVVSLSWVPGFCATHTDPIECGHGTGFALHGVWPQYNAQNYPSNCSTTPLPDAIRQQYQSIYASPSMIDHEWTKHGTCSGLDPAAYFQLSDSFHNKIVIPAVYQQGRTVGTNETAALKKAFQQANPGLPAAGITTTAANRVLTEVRFCVTKTGTFRACT
jgi:ribonuclease T2